jgi:hypothetical protein
MASIRFRQITSSNKLRARLLLYFLFLFGSISAHAGDRLWGAVLLASTVAQPKEGPAELKVCAARLKRVFRCNQLEVLGTDTEPLRDGAERTLIPTRHFWLTYKARRASVKEARGGYLLNLELYQEKKPLVDTVAMIAPESPLCFRGPVHPRGQIIVVLQVLQ